MAVYGISYYGADTYGASQHVDFDATPFVAEPQGYDRIGLSWKSPAGDWDTLRVLRNWNGFSVDESDGDVVLESDGPIGSAVDTNVRPGAWHYYSVWVEVAGSWARAAVSTTLMLQDHGYSDRLFDSLPLYNRLTQGAIDDLPAVENDALKKFLGVLSVGLNYIKTYYDSLRVLNDPMKNHLGQLVRLAEQFGIEYLPITPTGVYRSRVLNAGRLAREKGTREHVRSLIGMTVGWDVEITPGVNLMLNEDAASFIHPIWPDWDPAVNYATGEKVSFGGFVYQANAGGAYGEAQKPAGTATSNTWWTWINNLLDGTLVAPDGTASGWESKSFTVGVQPGLLSTGLGLGVQSETDPTVQGKNCLYLKNNTSGGVTADLGVTSVGNADVDPINAIHRGAPIPKADRAWEATTTYEVGDLVNYENLPYRAAQKSTNNPPSGTFADTPAWVCVGVGSRVRMTGSLYIKGGSVASMQDRLAYPVADFYDDRGNLIGTVDASADFSTNVFDSLASRPGALSGRTTDAGAKAWTTVGNWTVSEHGFVTASNQTGSVALITGAADGRVSVTLDSSPYGTSQQGLVVRWNGGASGNLTTASFLKATRTGLYSVASGTSTLLGTYSTAFSDKDRMTVSFVGTTIRVFRNGTQVLSVTSSVNSTSITHGIIVS